MQPSSNDQPLNPPRARAALLIAAQRRTSGHGPVTSAHAVAFVSSDLWPDMVAWLRGTLRQERLEFSGYRIEEDPTLPADTVRLEVH